MPPSWFRPVAGRVFPGLTNAALLIGFGGLLAWGFTEARKRTEPEIEQERPNKGLRRVTIDDGNQVIITLDIHAQTRIGLKTTTPAVAAYQERVRAHGTVLDIATLTSLNNAFLTAKAQLQTAQAKLVLSKATYERSLALYKEAKAISLAQLQTAEATFRTDEAALGAAESQVLTTTATAFQEWGPVLGQALVDGAPLIKRLIERQEFLLQITLLPGLLMPRAPATATLQTSSGAPAAISYLSPATRIDPKIQGVSFFYIASAESGVLPGMHVLVFLPKGPTVEGVSIPASAVVRWRGSAWVYLRTAPEKFLRWEILTDFSAPDAEGGYVVRGLPAGAELVMTGAQTLLSEEFRAQLQVGEEGK